jgi:protein tyrosine/serine phosphatase
MRRRNRSRASKTRAVVALALVSASLAGTGCVRAVYNFGTVDPGRIYRSAQPSPLLLRYVLWRYGIRTLVNLRGDTQGFESAFATRHGLRLLVLDLSASRPPRQDEVERFLAIVRDPSNYPILVHCRNGVDRTGYMLGLYRTGVQGWTVPRALREMNRFLQFEPLNPVPQRVVRGERAPS